MRVTDDRYLREMRRVQLAQRLIRHEVRTATIQQWTALTNERIRNLIHLHEAKAKEARRHRGPPPRNVAEFLRQTQLRSEASVMSAFAYIYGAMPIEVGENARRALPSVAAGERLCRAYETYRRVIPGSRLTLEQTMFLLSALAEGITARLAHCAHCRGVLLIDPSNLKRDICPWCEAREERDEPEALAPIELAEVAEVADEEEISNALLEPDGLQHRLF